MKKGAEKTRKNIFYKTNPRVGISLIVLVITIIVIIILAAAVIVSLQNNNPMAEANRARYESDVSNMQMIFTNAIGKIMAEKQEIIGIKPCQLNSVTKGVKSTEGEVTYTINGEDAGKIIFTNEASENKNDYITGKKLPIYNNETIWNVDDEGILRVGVGKNTYPNNDGSGGSGTTGGTTTTPDNGESVTISKEEYDTLKASIDLVKTEQTVIKNNYETMKSNYDTVKDNYDTLKTNYDTLNTLVKQLESKNRRNKSRENYNWHYRT